MLAAVCVLIATAALNDTLRTQEVAALTVALTHAESTFDVGPVLVATDTVKERILPPQPGTLRADPARIRDAARAAGLAAGTSDEAMSCVPNVACRPAGVYLGMIQVLEYLEPDPNTLVVTLQMMYWQVSRGFVAGIHIRIDGVHVTRTSPEAPWRIEKVVTLDGE